MAIRAPDGANNNDELMAKLNKETKFRCLGTVTLDSFFLKKGDFASLSKALSLKENCTKRSRTVWSEVVLQLPQPIPICFTS